MGICGVYGFSDKLLLDRMCECFPGEKKESFIDENVCFASNSMKGERCINSNEDGTLWIAYEGAIYNNDLLQEVLQEKGHQVTTPSDTEIILHLYEENGANFVNFTRGNFSCAIWDGNRKELLLLMEDTHYPIYYTIINENVVFSSRIKALLEYESYKKSLNIDVLDYLFSFGYIPGEDTPFYGIKKVPPYHLVKFRDGKKFTNRYWKIKYSQKTDLSEEKLVENVYSILSESVEIRMKKSEEPIGVLLSGGLDSCVIASLMKKQGQSVKAITVQYEEEKYSEPAAFSIADWLNIPIYERVLTSEDMIDILPKLALLYEDLIENVHVLIPTYAGIEHAKKHDVKTLFTGDGADTFFGGLSLYDHEKLCGICSKIPKPVREYFLIPSLKNLPAFMRNDTTALAKSIIKASTLPSNLQLLYADRLFEEDEIKELFAGRQTEGLKIRANDLLLKYLREVEGLDNISKRYYIFQMGSSTYGTTSEVRYSPICPKFSIRISTPFCDRELKEIAATIPFDLKQPSRNLTKNILRKVILKYNLLPREFVKSYRKKGFISPVERWLRGEVKEYITQTILDNSQIVKPILNEESLKKLLRSNRSRKILTIYLFILWYKNYFYDSKSCKGGK